MSDNKSFKVQNGLDVTGDANVSGSVTATSFIGDGSQLTGISGGSGGGLDSAAVASLIDSDLVGAESPNSYTMKIGANASRIAIGSGAVSERVNSISIGNNAGRYVNGGTGHVVIGDNAGGAALGGNGEAHRIVAIGTDASTNLSSAQYETVAIGYGAGRTDMGNYAIAIGSGSSSSSAGGHSVALGHNADATGSSAIAVGNGSEAASNFAVAVGHSATATTTGNIAIGQSASASVDETLSIGSNSIASSIGAMAIGPSSRVQTIGGFGGGPDDQQGRYGLAIGYSAETHGNYGIAIGANVDVDAINGIGIGENADVTNDYGINIRTSAAGSLTYDTTNDWVFGSSVTLPGATVSGHIIPDTNAAYDLGSAEKKFRHLYLSNNSLYAESGRLSFEGGQLTFRDDPVLMLSEVQAIAAASDTFEDFKAALASL